MNATNWLSVGQTNLHGFGEKSLVIFVIFEFWPGSESLYNALQSECISCRIRAFFHPENWLCGFGHKKEKSHHCASTLVWKKSPNGALICAKITFLWNRNEPHVLKSTPSWHFSITEMEHHCDFYLFFKSAPWWLFSKTKWQIYWSKPHYGANFFLSFFWAIQRL